MMRFALAAALFACFSGADSTDRARHVPDAGRKTSAVVKADASSVLPKSTTGQKMRRESAPAAMLESAKSAETTKIVDSGKKVNEPVPGPLFSTGVAPHWHWNTRFKDLEFASNNAAAQGVLDKPGTVVTGMGTYPELIKAVDTMPGKPLNFQENSVNNMEELHDASYVGPGKWAWNVTAANAVRPEAPKTIQAPTWFDGLPWSAPGALKFYHHMWMNPHTHLKSAYEPDYFHGNEEYFGPFRMNYADKTVYLDDWNFRMRNRENTKGRANLAVGKDHFYHRASNSFISGKLNQIRGNANAILGGEDNSVNGHGSSVMGGERNVANGVGDLIVGGYRNKAIGAFNTVIGGEKGILIGNYSSIVGGEDNIAKGYEVSVTGGDDNQAIGDLSSIGGGDGNKAKDKDSVIDGGEGQVTDSEYQVVSGLETKEERRIRAQQARQALR